jgi:hypothetical protein
VLTKLSFSPISPAKALNNCNMVYGRMFFISLQLFSFTFRGFVVCKNKLRQAENVSRNPMATVQT